MLPVRNRRFWLLGLTLASILHAAPHAAALKPETLDAWGRYVQTADAAMQARLQPGHPFLWVDQMPDGRRQLRGGEILVAGVGEQNPKKVPGGLIHHWVGAAFLPNSDLSSVLRIVRDYSHYRGYYNPTVLNARAIRQTADEDRFCVLLMNKVLFSKITLDTEWESLFTQAGSRRWYSMTSAIRVQEIDDYGQAGQHELPAGEGGGYIWRSHSITRYEQADGGVYVELEAMVLSRDIPAGLRWLVNPMVRRVSKSAMTTSLRQTLDAVNSADWVAARRPTSIPSQSSKLY
jgi:hypothetical protein